MSTVVLVIIATFLRVIYSIEQANEIEIEENNHSDHKIRNNIQHIFKDTENFVYNNIGRLSQTKLPYINCNREIFYNKQMDLIDICLASNDLINKYILKIDSIISKIVSIMNALKSIIIEENNMEIPTNVNDYSLLDNFNIPIASLKCKAALNNEFVKLGSILKHGSLLSIDAEILKALVDKIDDYVFEGFSFSFIHSHIKPSFALNKAFTIHGNSLVDTKDLVNNIIKEHVQLINTLNSFKTYLLAIKRFKLPIHILTPLIIKDNIIFKWGVECARRKGIYETTDICKLGMASKIMLYSINGCKMWEIISDIIDLIISSASDKFFKKLKLKRVSIVNEIFNTSNFESYEVEILKRTYVIKKFKLAEGSGLPTGMFTAHLNVNRGFSSLGYLAVESLNYTANPLFISVEQKMDFYITTSNFNILMNDEKQLFSFIFDFLNFLSVLKAYRINLISDNVIIGVNKADNRRWIYRIEEIGEFYYYKKEARSGNNKLFLDILSKSILLVKDQKLLEYFYSLRKFANQLNVIGEIRFSKKLLVSISIFKSKNNEYFNTDEIKTK